jgi:hypothetical protein
MEGRNDAECREECEEECEEGVAEQAVFGLSYRYGTTEFS